MASRSSRWSSTPRPGSPAAKSSARRSPTRSPTARPSARVDRLRTAAHGSAPAERVEERAELALGLVDLGGGVARGDDARARRTGSRARRGGARSAARSRTPRRPRRRPSRPVPRTRRARTVRARRSRRATATTGHPPIAGVGCNASARSSAVGAGAESVPSNRVDRCHTVGVACSTGSGSQRRSSHRGPRASATASTTIACSSRSFGEASRRSAFAWSSAGSPARGAVPASGFDLTVRPRRDTRSSGVAPTSVPSPEGAANVHASGFTARSRWASATGSSTRPASTSSVRARTTLRRSPPEPIRAVAVATDAAYPSGAGCGCRWSAVNASAGAARPCARANAAASPHEPGLARRRPADDAIGEPERALARERQHARGDGAVGRRAERGAPPRPPGPSDRRRRSRRPGRPAPRGRRPARRRPADRRRAPASRARSRPRAHDQLGEAAGQLQPPDVGEPGHPQHPQQVGRSRAGRPSSAAGRRTRRRRRAARR